MAKETEISVTRWLEVRDQVTETLKRVSPRTEAATHLKMAEALISQGQIDIEFISNQIDEAQRKRDEATAAREREASARAQAAKKP